MRDSFAWLEKQFHHVRETNEPQQKAALLKQLDIFTDQYIDVIEVDEQILVAQALEYQLMLFTLNDQQAQAARVEDTLNKEFCGIHKIGKPININPNAPRSNGKLNLASNLLDMGQLKQWAIKQKGSTKPNLLGWFLKGSGLALIGLAAWLFSMQWIWTPLIIGIIGVLLSTIGSQVTNVVNHFLSSAAFNLGTIIPGVITKVRKDNYQVTFLAPLMKTKNQATRWGVKTISFNRLAGLFQEGDQLAGVCLFSQTEGDYYQDFTPTPICLGYRNEVISYKAKQVIAEVEWEILQQVIDHNKKEMSSLIVIDDNLQKIY